MLQRKTDLFTYSFYKLIPKLNLNLFLSFPLKFISWWRSGIMVNVNVLVLCIFDCLLQETAKKQLTTTCRIQTRDSLLCPPHSLHYCTHMWCCTVQVKPPYIKTQLRLYWLASCTNYKGSVFDSSPPRACDWHWCHNITPYSTFFKSRETINALCLDFSEI